MIDDKFSGSISDAIFSKALTRSDFQLLHRNWHDMKRVPIFALVFIVCGEFTPLIVIAIGGIVPWTCRIPSKSRTIAESSRSGAPSRSATLPLEPLKEEGAGALERMQLLHICWSLGLGSRAWDWLGGQYPGLPNWVLRRKVGRRLDYLEMDDKLIRECGGVGEMEEREVRMACVERGVDVLGKSNEQLSMDLDAWLNAAEEVSVERLLLTR